MPGPDVFFCNLVGNNQVFQNIWGNMSSCILHTSSSCGSRMLQFGQLSCSGQFWDSSHCGVISSTVTEQKLQGKQRNRSSFREMEWNITQWSVPVSEWPHLGTKGHYSYCFEILQNCDLFSHAVWHWDMFASDYMINKCLIVWWWWPGICNLIYILLSGGWSI